jgi:hypothetical protein
VMRLRRIRSPKAIKILSLGTNNINSLQIFSVSY